MNKDCYRIGIKQAKEKTCLKSSKIHSHQTKKKEFITERLTKKELITQRLAKKEFITEWAPRKEGIHYREGC
jgi:hypothetical protein